MYVLALYIGTTYMYIDNIQCVYGSSCDEISVAVSTWGSRLQVNLMCISFNCMSLMYVHQFPMLHIKIDSASFLLTSCSRVTTCSVEYTSVSLHPHVQ